MAANTERVWRASGVVSLLTDFGLIDPYVGVMHGVILSSSPTARVVDLTHGVPPQDIAVAAFYLERAWSYFPNGTIHVAVVDPGVGSSRRILAVGAHGHVFLAPDNGLLTCYFEPATFVRALDIERFSLRGRSRTFHGRDVFAPAAARLVEGLDPRELGPECSDPVRREGSGPRRLPERAIEAHVLFADRFGNLVTDLRASDLEGGPSQWVARVGERRIPLLATYSEARAGELIALVDSFGCVELAVVNGSAAQRLALSPGAKVRFERT
ncbi:MAG: SAM-dependent chlorinase/fluorinase [Planctomycetes bacterium]|nr:SAM-dependent chlorinase/fluorinase [Planctomycetota bacterium]